MQAYLTHQYREERGKEFAQHGAGRSMHFTAATIPFCNR